MPLFNIVRGGTDADGLTFSPPISRRLQIQYVHCTFSSEKDVHELTKKGMKTRRRRQRTKNNKEWWQFLQISQIQTIASHFNDVFRRWWNFRQLSTEWLKKYETEENGKEQKRTKKLVTKKSEKARQKKQTDHYIRCIIKLTSFGSHGMISHGSAQRASCKRKTHLINVYGISNNVYCE